MLTAVNINRDFTQSLMLILIDLIEAARTLLLNIQDKKFKKENFDDLKVLNMFCFDDELNK